MKKILIISIIGNIILLFFVLIQNNNFNTINNNKFKYIDLNTDLGLKPYKVFDIENFLEQNNVSEEDFYKLYSYCIFDDLNYHPNAILDTIKHDAERDPYTDDDTKLPLNYYKLKLFLLETPESAEGKIYNSYSSFTDYDSRMTYVNNINDYLKENNLDKKSLTFLKQIITDVYNSKRLDDNNTIYSKGEAVGLKGYKKKLKNLLEQITKKLLSNPVSTIDKYHLFQKANKVLDES